MVWLCGTHWEVEAYERFAGWPPDLAFFAGSAAFRLWGVVGKREGEGPLAADFDVIHKDNYLGQKSFEAAEQKLLEEACNVAVRHSAVGRDELSLHFSGDLLNQITSSSFTARSLGVPYLGLFGACSTFAEGQALAAP